MGLPATHRQEGRSGASSKSADDSRHRAAIAHLAALNDEALEADRDPRTAALALGAAALFSIMVWIVVLSILF